MGGNSNLHINLFFLPLEMAEYLTELRERFPNLPKDLLREIYRCRLERMRLLTRQGLPEDLRWIIEAEVRPAGEYPNSFEKRMVGMGRSSYAKKRRTKRMSVCHKCARWTCNTCCKNKGMVSVNREDKIQFIKDGLSKKSLDDIVQTLETHPRGQVQGVLLTLAKLFNKQKECCTFKNLTLTDPIC